MSPTLKPGRLVVLKDVYTPRVGDIVMVRHDGLEKIKRVSQVDGNKIYLLGDNPTASTDSRDFGWLDATAIIGRLLWPGRKSIPAERVVSHDRDSTVVP